MTHQPETARELASLAVNAGRALQDEKRHYEIACQENARLRAALARIRQMTDYWEQHLPEVIRTPAVVSALRAAMERAASAAVSAAVAPPTTQAALRERIAEALLDHLSRTADIRTSSSGGVLAFMPEVTDAERMRMADAVLAVLPEVGDKAAVLREAADALDAGMERFFSEWPDEPRNSPYALGQRDAANELRRMADETATETPTADLPTLAAALDGLHTLIATSSRDWQTYRVDAWLWAVLCGWDCEQTEHDDTCVHGALEETAARHGWDEATIAKARRYRAAVRAVTEHQPADETATETPEDPARIDRLRPEFTEHASVEAIDAQLDRARRQERRWHIRAEWLIGLRQARAEQPAAGARQDGAET